MVSFGVSLERTSPIAEFDDLAVRTHLTAKQDLVHRWAYLPNLMRERIGGSY